MSSSYLATDLEMDGQSVKETYQENPKVPTSPASMFSLTASRFMGNKIKGKSPYISNQSFISYSSTSSSSSMSIGSIENISSGRDHESMTQPLDDLNSGIRKDSSQEKRSDTVKSNPSNNNNSSKNSSISKLSSNLKLDYRQSNNNNNNNNNKSNNTKPKNKIANDTFDDLSFNVNVNPEQPTTTYSNNKRNIHNSFVRGSYIGRSFSDVPYNPSLKKNNSHPSSIPNTLSISSSSSSSSSDEESIIDYTSDFNNSTRLKNSKNQKPNKYHDQDQLIAVLESITQVTKNFQEGNSRSNKRK